MTMTALASIQEENGLLSIKGKLSFSEVMHVWEASLPWLKKQATLLLDLGQVGVCDSAGLALVLEWIKYAKAHQKTIRFSNMPAQLMSIAKVSGLQTLVDAHI